MPTYGYAIWQVPLGMAVSLSMNKLLTPKEFLISFLLEVA